MVVLIKAALWFNDFQTANIDAYLRWQQISKLRSLAQMFTAGYNFDGNTIQKWNNIIATVHVYSEFSDCLHPIKCVIQGPVSLMIFCPQFKFDGNFAFL